MLHVLANKLQKEKGGRHREANRGKVKSSKENDRQLKVKAKQNFMLLTDKLLNNTYKATAVFARNVH